MADHEWRFPYTASTPNFIVAGGAAARGQSLSLHKGFQDAYPGMRHAVDETDTNDNGSDEGLAETSSCEGSEGRRLACVDAASRSSVPSHARYQAPRVELPEQNLTDLDEAEGRRRGEVLLALLGATPYQQVAPERQPDVSPARWTMMSNAAPFFPQGAGSATLQSAHTDFSQKQEDSLSCTFHSLVSEAALRAFGDDLAHVEGDLRCGFIVQLSEMCGFRHASERLQELATELWPLLPSDTVLALEPNAMGKRAWLTMHYVTSAPENSCRDAILTADIEVTR